MNTTNTNEKNSIVYDMAILDTCLLLHPSFPQKLQTIVRSARFILIPNSVLEELRYLSAESGDMKVRSNASRILQEMEILRANGVVNFFGDRTVVEAADLSILRYLAVNRFGSAIAVFTQDVKLSRDILRLAEMSCFADTALPPLAVYKLYGAELVPFIEEPEKKPAPDAQTQNAKNILAKYGIAV